MDAQLTLAQFLIVMRQALLTAKTAARQLAQQAIAVATVRPVLIERLLAGEIRARVM